MTPTSRRRASLTILATLLLGCGLAQRSHALSFLTDVTKERAKELGIVVTSKPSANDDLWVQVEFKTVGDMKVFTTARLEVRQGTKRLVSAALQPIKTDPNNVRLDVYMDPAAVPNTTVTIYVYNQPRSGIGYRLNLKDFVAGG